MDKLKWMDSFFPKTQNPNRKAKNETLKTGIIICLFLIFALGFYLYTNRSHHPKQSVKATFDGALQKQFSNDSQDALYQHNEMDIDETRKELNNSIDKLSHEPNNQIISLENKVNDLSDQLSHITKMLKTSHDNATHVTNPKAQNISKEQSKTINVNNLIHRPIVNIPPTMINTSYQYSIPVHPISRNSNNYVWAGTFVEGYLLTGVNGDAGINATKNQGMVLIRLTGRGTMPNGQHSHLIGCIITASSYGDLSGNTDVLRVQTISCASRTISLEKRIYGAVFDWDAMQDLRGTPVLKAGNILSYSALAGALAGLGKGIQNSGTTSFVSPISGGTTIIPTGSILRQGIGGAIESPSEKVSDYLMKIANLYHPLVIVHAGRRVTVVFQKGFWIDKHHQEFSTTNTTIDAPQEKNVNSNSYATTSPLTTFNQIASNNESFSQNIINRSKLISNQAYDQAMQQYLQKSNELPKQQPIFSSVDQRG